MIKDSLSRATQAERLWFAEKAAREQEREERNRTVRDRAARRLVAHREAESRTRARVEQADRMLKDGYDPATGDRLAPAEWAVRLHPGEPLKQAALLKDECGYRAPAIYLFLLSVGVRAREACEWIAEHVEGEGLEPQERALRALWLFDLYTSVDLRAQGWR